MNNYCDHRICTTILRNVITGTDSHIGRGAYITCKYAPVIAYAIKLYPSEYAHKIVAPALKYPAEVE